MLVHPIRAGLSSYAAQPRSLFLSGNVCECVSHSSEIFIASAGLRVANNLKAIDALHFSTALALGCQFFLTNDAYYLHKFQLNRTVGLRSNICYRSIGVCFGFLAANYDLSSIVACSILHPQ